MLNIIIPLYKGRDTLPKTLDSLVAQTKTMFIVTIVNDADGEDYSTILDDYRARGLHINYYVLKENSGPGVARQYGFDQNKLCDYVMFLDADDLLMPRAVEVLYTAAKQEDADIMTGNFYVERKYKKPILMEAGKIPCTWVHGRVYKVKYLQDNDIRFLKDLRVNEDSYFNLVAYNCTKKRGIINEVVHLWRDNKNSLTRSEDNDEFFKKGGIQYLKSQVFGLLKIAEIDPENKEELTAMTLINAYKCMMRAAHLHMNLKPFEKTLNYIYENKWLMQQMDSDKFWLRVVKDLPACQAINKSIFFYQMRFIDWINKYLRKPQ